MKHGAFETDRNTKATRRVLDNVNMVVERLKEGPMTPLEVGCVLNMSPSGSRKYLRQMSEFGLVTRDANNEFIDGEQSIFNLTADQSILDRFAKLVVAAHASATPVRQYDKYRNKPGAGCNMHIMQDDMEFHVKRSRVVPYRDPLVAALFGNARGAA